MKSSLSKFLFLALTTLLFLNFTSLAQADGATTSTTAKGSMQNQAEKMNKMAGFGDASVDNIAAAVIETALSLLGIIFLVIIIFAGYRWMTASGNEEEVKKAQEAIKRGIIGLLIVILAYAVTSFVFNALPFEGFNSSNLVTS